MNKLLPLIAFTILLIVPVGVQNVFAMTFDVQNGGPIPPGGTSGTTIFRFNVVNEAQIRQLDVHLFLEHTKDQDLIISLTSPLGTTVVLSDRRGGSGDNYIGTLFSDITPLSISQGSPPFTGTFRPDQQLSNFNFEDPNGIWTLTVDDVQDPEFGFLYKTGDTFSSGSTVSTGTQLIFRDVLPPVALCQDATVPLNANGQATITPTDVDAGSFDNVALLGLGVTPNSFSCANLGPNTVTLVAQDTSPFGFTSDCQAIVTVEDPQNVCSTSNQFVGGEMIPIDKTALLLANTQSFSWMIPVVISGIGIGMFVVSRKSENS